MKPLDPRLLGHARAARRYVLLTAAWGVLTAALVVAQALLLAGALAPVVERTADWTEVAPTVGLLALVMALRAGAVGAQERFAHRAAARTIAELREKVLVHVVALGPRWLAEGRAAAVATLVTRGLESLEPYFVRYLPQLLLAATVTPAALLVVLRLDWIAAVTIGVTLPLVPLFMALVGRLTQGYAGRRLASLQRLGDQVLDLIAGLATLTALGRETGPGERVRRLGESHRRATMDTLRVAFLSGMVLELLTTLAVALVAVGIGFRLLSGDLDLTTGLAVLVLAPEVYLPLRQVGAHFHASADGVAAAEEAFRILEVPRPSTGHQEAPDLRTSTISLCGVEVHAADRAVSAPSGLDLDVRPGPVVALAGPNGSGKSTAVDVLLGLLVPDAGTVVIRPADRPAVPLQDVDLTGWWAQVAWLPQRPVLEPGTVEEAVLHGRRVPAPTLASAARTTGLDRVLVDLPDGWATVVGQGGAGLSLGQRQRVALTRALVGTEQLVVLDEPTAHLDAGSAEEVARVVLSLRDAGRTVLIVSHRAELLDCADHVVRVHTSDVPALATPPRCPMSASPRGAR